MPDKSNMFWTVYKKLETDVIDLSYYIHFSDEPTKSGHNQIWTFSNQIADLLIAISIQIESLFLELYNSEFNSKPEDIGAGIKAIDKKWNLSAKQVKIISKNMHFINTNGWLIKKYTAGQEARNIVISEKIAGIVYRDKIEIVKL